MLPPMQLLDQLRDEHVLIEAVLGSLRRYVSRRLAGEAGAGDAEAFVGFFRLWAGQYHHAREEDVLFPALARELELPMERGPIAALTAQHHEMAAMLDALAPLLVAERPSPDEAERMRALATSYTRALWAHIDAENTVLLPESAERLARKGVRELDGRAPTEAERAAERHGRRLVSAHPPEPDPGAERGEGCIVCPSYGTRCDGLEREWWHEHEWEDFFERNGSG